MSKKGAFFNELCWKKMLFMSSCAFSQLKKSFYETSGFYKWLFDGKRLRKVFESDKNDQNQRENNEDAVIHLGKPFGGSFEEGKWKTNNFHLTFFTFFYYCSFFMFDEMNLDDILLIKCAWILLVIAWSFFVVLVNQVSTLMLYCFNV